MFTRFCSNLRDCRVEAEIADESGAIVAFVYEDQSGWHVERIGAPPIDLDGADIDAAKIALTRYVNRMGANPPEGLTAAGLALWLMTKSDGTSMGVKL